MMRARCLPLLLLLSLAVAREAPAQFTIGAFGGLNSARLSGDAPDDYSYAGKSGFAFGLILEHQITDDVWLSVQPMILPRGAGIEFKSGDEEEPQKVADLSLSYFAVPVLAKFVTVGGKVYVISGINLSFLTGANLKGVEDNAEEVDVKDSFESVDLAVDFGVGGQLPLGRVKIMLEARYEQGLFNIAGDDISEDALRARLRSSGLQLLVGVLLPLGGGR
ncbi:MAG: PorT family protein [Gemmatimonadetes bacterium]|nr:PorT family protein [Gemmatimonadota bacterium]